MLGRLDMFSDDTNIEKLHRLIDDYLSNKVCIRIITDEDSTPPEYIDIPIKMDCGEPWGFQSLTFNELMGILSQSRDNIKLELDNL